MFRRETLDRIGVAGGIVPRNFGSLHVRSIPRSDDEIDVDSGLNDRALAATEMFVIVACQLRRPETARRNPPADEGSGELAGGNQ
jgi:hypothetical protein